MARLPGERGEQEAETSMIWNRKTLCCLAFGMAFSGVAAAVAATDKEKLMRPDSLKEKAPAEFKVRFETTKGDFVVQVHRDWSPNGVDRLYNLVKNGYYDQVKFFRVVPNFVVQFGIHGDPSIARVWSEANIPDDPVKQSNLRGYVTYAKSARPNSRSTQLFINLKDNSSLDQQGFSPIGKVVEGMEVVDRLHSGYGEKITGLQGRIVQEGNAFLEKEYPQLDGIKRATIVP